MRVLRSATNTSQKVLIGTNNCMSKPIRAAKLKKSANNAKSDSKQVQKALFSGKNKENFTPEKPESVLVQNSKKIQKTSQKETQIGTTRKVFADITNISKNKPSQEKSCTKPQVEKIFEEDTIKQTSNYVALSYVNKHTQHNYQFYCFHDRDLGVPLEFATKTITQKCDNDCTTDDDQIRGAIRNVYKSIESYIKSQQESDTL